MMLSKTKPMKDTEAGKNMPDGKLKKTLWTGGGVYE